MKPLVRDILEALEKIAPQGLAEPWDNPGLQVGSLGGKVNKVMVALDPSVATLRGAVEEDAQVLLTHHPLIFKPITSIEANTGPGPVLFEAIREEISIVSVHTNLDAAIEGVNQVLANMLSLEAIEPLSPSAGEGLVGIGRIGLLPRSLSVEDFVGNVKEIFGLKVVRVVNPKKAQVRRVAVVGGSGGGFIQVARSRGADILFTGDLKYHQAREAEAIGLTVVDGGHFSTEIATMGALRDSFERMCNELGWEVDVVLYEKEQDPFLFV
ncbi:MAG TPA: Nif3-like dinuclear metal center hexameric protein [Desulfobacterales bacterium]|nr:Nif3-like dinuclear metal center hexameric protein [Desulfobacterales bacterium]